MSAKGKTPYWWTVMEKAERRLAKGRHPFTAAEETKASSWVTCACGKQDKLIPRYPETSVVEGEPVDPVLSRAGFDFFDAVRAGDVKSAKRLLVRIERRAIQLLKQPKTLKKQAEEASSEASSLAEW